MISIKYDYSKTKHNRYEVISWARENGGVIIRGPGKCGYLGYIHAVDFESEADAVAFRLRFGL